MRTSFRTNLRSNRSGFTLVEAVLSCLIVGIVLVPALQLVGDSAQSRTIQTEQSQAMTLARALLTEIVQCRYNDPDIDTGETRSTWDDVSDFDGLSESPPTTSTGTTMTEFTGWRRIAKIRLVSPANPASTSATDAGMKEITITVTSPTGRSFSLSALRSDKDMQEKTASLESTYTSWVDVTLEAGTGKTSVVRSGVRTLNQTP